MGVNKVLTVKVKDIPAGWLAAIDDFAGALRAGGAPASTIGTRRAHLSRVARCLGGDPWELDADRLVAWCGRQDWAVETRRGVRASLTRFYGWAVATGRTEVDPAAALPKVRAASPTPRPAPEIAYREALGRADARSRLILRLAAEVGLRRAEVAQVHSRDLIEDLEGWSLIVHGKGGRQRVVPLPDGLAVALRARPAGWAFPRAVQRAPVAEVGGQAGGRATARRGDHAPATAQVRYAGIQRRSGRVHGPRASRARVAGDDAAVCDGAARSALRDTVRAVSA